MASGCLGGWVVRIARCHSARLIFYRTKCLCCFQLGELFAGSRNWVQKRFQLGQNKTRKPKNSEILFTTDCLIHCTGSVIVEG